MFCSKCGNELDASNKYCVNCGFRIKGKEEIPKNTSVTFSKRMNRKRYIISGLVFGLSSFVLVSFQNYIIGRFSGIDPIPNTIINVILIYLAACIFYNFVRRLHDINKSGWYSLLVLVPIVGLWVAIIMLGRSVDENNKYGPKDETKISFWNIVGVPISQVAIDRSRVLRIVQIISAILLALFVALNLWGFWLLLNNKPTYPSDPTDPNDYRRDYQGCIDFYDGPENNDGIDNNNAISDEDLNYCFKRYPE
ncbi:MAG: DUF805 domain-containing protein [bacterium]